MQTFFIPEVPLSNWHTWFAWYPVRTSNGKKRWLSRVERRRMWFVYSFYEYRAIKGT